MDVTIATFWDKWNPWSFNLMKAPRNVSKPKSGNTSKPANSSRIRKIRIGVESMDHFFSRMRVNARELDRGERLEPGLILTFEDPADFLEVITQRVSGFCRKSTGKPWRSSHSPLLFPAIPRQ